MYKRRARVVFVGGSAPCVAVLAQALAQRFGSQWIESRAACAVPPLHCPPATSDGVALAGVPAVLDASLLQWADLVVCLDEAAEGACPVLPAGVRRIRWPAVAVAAHLGVDDSALRRVLEERIQGMVGGMRLLAGLDRRSP